MLPPIDLSSLRTNYKSQGDPPCLLCGRKVNLDRAKWVLLSEDLGEIIDPATPEPHGGFHPVGGDCFRKHNLKPYGANI